MKLSQIWTFLFENCLKSPRKKSFFLLILPYKTWWKLRFPMVLRPLVKGPGPGRFRWFFTFLKKNRVFGYSWSTLLWQRCYYLHWSRDALSPVCGIFAEGLPPSTCHVSHATCQLLDGWMVCYPHVYPINTLSILYHICSSQFSLCSSVSVYWNVQGMVESDMAKDW